MTALLLETSSLNSVIALFDNGVLRAAQPLPGDRTLSKNLLPCIEKLLNSQLKQLDYIAVGIGPGSYTGTRVGSTVAKTLSYALNIPLVDFCSPQAFIPMEEGVFAHVTETKKGDYFILKGRKKAGRFLAPLDHKQLSYKELASELQSTHTIISDQPLNIQTSAIWTLPQLQLPPLLLWLHEKWQNPETQMKRAIDLIYF